MIRLFLSVVAIFMPNRVKICFYNIAFGYKLHSSARIGFSIIICEYLRMDAGAKIGHFNVLKGMSEVCIGEKSTVGNLNWISGFPRGSHSGHFSTSVNRSPRLAIGRHSAITNRHYIDCTDAFSIGSYTTFAGVKSQVLTHSISINLGVQVSGPVSIGDYVFVGTGVILLPNSRLPNYSVLAAGAVLNKVHSVEYSLYAGIPADFVKSIDASVLYFNRDIGYVI